MKELVGVQAPFHEGFDLPSTRQFDRSSRGLVAILNRDEFAAVDVESFGACQIADLARVSNQDRHDESCGTRNERAFERKRITWINDRRTNRRQRPTPFD